ncbi:UvrABC system protein A [Pseudomonas savastanoi pv. glycinea]|uniref:UvrABC system protein A n=2 Tax=Pseudomonas savastanoi TaxID=29438 RepID=A0A3M3V023_PSESG|nr:UvrABC system protein A [Pseudomonas savastanoi pv. glycinea]
MTFLLAVDDERDHREKGNQQGGQVDPPVLFLGQTGFFDQRQRQGHEAGHEHRMQHEDTQIQAQQVRMTQRRPKCLPGNSGFAVHQRAIGFGHHKCDDQKTQQGHTACGQEQSRKAKHAGDDRADDHGDGERQADGHADHGHGLGAMLFAGQVREQGHDRGGNRAGTLQDAPGDDSPDRIGICRHHAANRKNDQAEINNRSPSDTVGNDPKRNLQHCLGQAISANRQTDQCRARARQVHAVGCQNRQNHEHAKHAEREHQGQTACCAGLAATHTLAVGIVHGITSCEPAAILPVPSLYSTYATLCRVMARSLILRRLCPPSEAAVDKILIRGARTHNLKNIDLTLPRDKLIVITGLSGSGKSSLAFDTLYAEGQRRYVESLSAYARQFLSMMEKPDVDTIEGLSPAISIEQKSTSHNPRSTVGTITEIYDYLRLLYARVGQPRCPDHDIPLEAQTVSQMVDLVLTQPEGSKLMLLAPVIRERKGEHLSVFEELRAQGFVRARVNGKLCELDELPKLDKQKKHSIDVVVDRFKVRADLQQRLAESFETALKLADGIALVAPMDDEPGEEVIFSARFACPICGHAISELEPKLFSFNNPAGACPTCDGLGVKQFFDIKRLVNAELTLAEGAIRGWDRRNVYYFQMLGSLSKHYGFSLEVPFKEIPADMQKVLLNGSGSQSVDFRYLNDRGDIVKRAHPFEGIVPNLERRYRETESATVREELAKFLGTQPCPDCRGTRLRREARHVWVGEKTLPAVTNLPIGDATHYFETLKLTGRRGEIADKILKEIRERLQFLVNVGLDYLTLDRSADTLSGGEAQRIRLASQIGAGLVGVMYILDEPSIGLHQRDNDRLLGTLKHLRDIGNTVIVVEHDEDAIRLADYVVDIGPGAGVHGGHIVAEGTPDEVMSHPDSLTGKYLSGRVKIAVPAKRTPRNKKLSLTLKGARGNNLQNVNLDIPIGLLTCVTGVSGSGKSTLINNTLFPLSATALNGATTLEAAAHDSINGLQHLDKVVDIDQSPIGRTPRSNPATYTGLFTPIRELFAGVPESRSRGYGPGRFSFNVKGGRCEACQGDGLIKVEMHFLPDIYVPCDVCKSKRYNRETLEIKYKGKNVHEVLEMTIEEAREFFDAVPALARKLQTLMDVGLSYIKLGQSATTLSGGEAQRVKLSRELSKRDTGKTLYILDEPTTGLHFADIQQLLDVLHRLRDHGNTVVVIEHNLDVIKTADWLVDLGPEGGSRGGQIIATGTPEQVAEMEQSYTGHYLKPLLIRDRA